MRTLMGLLSIGLAILGGFAFAGKDASIGFRIFCAAIGFFLPSLFIAAARWAISAGFAKTMSTIGKSRRAIKKPAAGEFCLSGGTATGVLRDYKSHAAGAFKGQQMYFDLSAAAQNFCVMGGIGSGKTTRIVQPFLDQLLSQKIKGGVCGGLIFDIKGDFGRTVEKLAATHKRPITVIGINKTPLNLLKGLKPEMAASFLKSAFYLSGNSADAFWIESATELCKNALGILNYCPGHYSLTDLRDFLWDEAKRTEFLQTGEMRAGLTDRDSRLFAIYRDYYANTYSDFDPKVKQSILATCSQVLSGFSHPDLADYFCSDTDEGANLEDLLGGQIFLVDLPLAIWGMSAKTVYMMIKLRFFNTMQTRQARPDLNQTNPVFFMCDEYQEIIAANKHGLSDLNFWDKSRSSKTIGIISGQSIESFRAAVGDPVVCDAVLQNFRNKYFFRTESEETIKYMQQLAGQAEVERQSTSESTTSGSHGQDQSGVSTSLQLRAAVDAQMVRQLGPNGAIAFLNIGGRAVDDVVTLTPLFVDL